MPQTTQRQPLPLRSLKISTRLRLHPEFFKDPWLFAHRNSVKLVSDVFPETSFKKSPDSSGKRAKVKANIHLVQHGAIRLFIERDGEDDWVRSIELNPSMLLHGDENYPLVEEDLAVSLSILKTTVTPLLADPLDVCHIIPGHGGDDGYITFCNFIKSQMLRQDIQLACLHHINHPDAGPAEGATEKRVQLGDDRDDCVISFEAVKWDAPTPSGTPSVEGVRISLRLKGDMLVAKLGQPGKTALVKGKKRLIKLKAHEFTRMQQDVLSLLTGTFLPVPPEWEDGSHGKPVTHAKTIALLSVLTSIPLEELRAMDEKIRQPSKSTHKRLNKDIPIHIALLKSFPVATLFQPAVDATQVPEITPEADVAELVKIDPK